MELRQQMTKIATRESSTRIQDKEPYILNEWMNEYDSTALEAQKWTVHTSQERENNSQHPTKTMHFLQQN